MSTATGASRTATKVLSEAVTAEETNILHQNVLGGTAGRSAINCPTAAKTGTTSELDRRLARRLHTRLLDRRVDGLSDQTRVHDRRSRRATAGWIPAGGNLARLHGAVTEGEPCANSHRPKEALSYQPFYGKYATTGQAQAATGSKPTEKRGQEAASPNLGTPNVRPGPADANARHPRPSRPHPGTTQRQQNRAARPRAEPTRPAPRGASLVVWTCDRETDGRCPHGLAARLDAAWRRRTRLNSRAR